MADNNSTDKVFLKATNSVAVNTLSNTTTYPINPGTVYFTADGYIVHDFRKKNSSSGNEIDTRQIMNAAHANDAAIAVADSDGNQISTTYLKEEDSLFGVTFGDPTTLIDNLTLSFAKDGDNDWYITGEDVLIDPSTSRHFTIADFKENTLYKVTWDGTEYNLFYAALGKIYDSCSGVYGWGAIGQSAPLGASCGYDIDAPFCIAYDYKRNSSEIQVFSYDTNTSHTISIIEVPYTKKSPNPYYWLHSSDNNLIIGKGSGYLSVIEGYGIDAGDVSHAEGYSQAMGTFAHAEGATTSASAYGSHAENTFNEASGYASHAEGFFNKASGYWTHAEGGYNIASKGFQHVAGLLNIEDTYEDTTRIPGVKTGKYLRITGNGAAATLTRSNAETLDWDGNLWAASDVKIGGTSQDDATVSLSQLSQDVANLKDGTASAASATNLASAGTWAWTNGTNAGPTATLTIGGKDTSIAAIPSASATQSGVVTTGAQTFAGDKTFTGVIKVKTVNSDSYAGGLNMNNSNIYNLNGIYTADVADSGGEGINFYRDTTHVDSLWINNGNIYFNQNRPLGTSIAGANSNVVLHNGNLLDYGVVLDDSLLTTNPFGGRKLYISKIDNAFYCADKRWTVTGSYTDGTTTTTYSSSELAKLFNGDYENSLSIPTGCTATIRVTFDTEPVGSYNNARVFPGYPYGYFFLSYYYNQVPTEASQLKVYCNYSAHGIGETSVDFSLFNGEYYSSSGSRKVNVIERARNDKYAISYAEFVIHGNSSYAVAITQLEFKLDRPSSQRNPFVSKYVPETLYYNLTAPSFTGSLVGNVTGNATSANKISTTLATTTKAYLLGTSTTPTSTAAAVSTVADTGVYLDTTAGRLTATSFKGALIGNADTATSATKAAQLTTARDIILAGNLQGSASFNGTQSITITALNYQAAITSNNKANYPWHRIATVTVGASTYSDKVALLRIRHTYHGGGEGLVKVSVRTNASGAACNVSAIWLYRYNITEANIGIGLYGVTGDNVYADVYYKSGTYARGIVESVSNNRIFTLIGSSEVKDTTTTDKLTSTEVYTSIETAATELRSQDYTQIVYGADGASTSVASKLGTSDVGSTKLPIYLKAGVPTAGATNYTFWQSNGTSADSTTVAQVLNAIYPVGSILMTNTSANPNTRTGFENTTWVAYGAGRVPVGFSSGDNNFGTVGGTGGSKTVTSSGSISGTAISVAQMPSHGHPVCIWDDAGTKAAAYFYRGATQETVSSGRLYTSGSSNWQSSSFTAAQSGRGDPSGGTVLVGGGETHAHTYTGNATSVLQPYITCYMWLRTA